MPQSRVELMDTNDTLVGYAENETDYDNSTTEDNNQCSEPYPLSVPPAVDYAQAAITIVIITLSMTINSMIIYLIARFKQLQQRSFYLALQHIIVNLIYTLFVLPTVVVTSIVHSWVFGSVMCLVIGGSNTLFFSAHYMMLIVMALDRLLVVFMPFFYNRHGNKIAVGLSIIFWLFIISSLTASIVLGCYAFASTYKTCSVATCGRACAVYAPLYASIMILSGLLVPLVLYLILYLKGRQLQHNVEVGMSPEEKAKAAFNGRICKTFAVIALALIGVGFVAFIFCVWFIIASEVTLKYYIAQSLIGRTLSNSITIVDPIIILRNRDVRDAWAERRRLPVKCVRKHSV